MTDARVGTVTHYFQEPEVGVILLEAPVEVGDVVRFEGHTTGFRQEIESMEVDHEPVDAASSGDEVAVKVRERVREGDAVLRVEDG